MRKEHFAIFLSPEHHEKTFHYNIIPSEQKRFNLVLCVHTYVQAAVNSALSIGLDKICFFFCLFCFAFMLDKSTYFAPSFTHFAFFLHTVIKVQAQISESNEQGCIAT